MLIHWESEIQFFFLQISKTYLNFCFQKKLKQLCNVSSFIYCSPFSCNFSGSNRRTVELLTRDQCNYYWDKMRKGKVTSTKVGPVCRRKAWNRVRNEILDPPDLSYIPYVARGLKDEDKGVQIFCFLP